jgi:rubrerythrin
MNTDLLHRFDADVLGVTGSRRDALGKGLRFGAAAALTMVPFLSSAKRAFAAQPARFSRATDVEILNYALTLEYLERAFYRKAIATNLVPTANRPLYDMLASDENEHVQLLSSTLSSVGADPVEYDDDDFTFEAGGTDFLSSFQLINTLAQGLEDTGVRAYKGQAADIDNSTYLTVALQIHSVEARHAAAVRRINENMGWIPLDQPNAAPAIAPVYGDGDDNDDSPSEANVTQGGIDLSARLSGYTREQISAAFDEPLGMSTVLGIAGGFITGQEGD